MNASTRRAAYQLLAALTLDPSAQSDASSVFGNWSEHLQDQLTDDDMEDE